MSFSLQSQSLSKIAIRRHIGTLMLTLAVIVIGVFFLLGLQVDLLPAITYPRIGVRVDAPGISPEILVEEITKPLEQALSTTEGIVQVYSSTREGRVRINLYFEPGGKIEQALNDATASLNRVRSRLPDIAEEPRIFKFDPSQQPVYEFAVESPNLDAVGLRIFAEEELSRELAIVPGVAAVDVAGGLQEEVRVEVNAKRLQGLGISLKQILTALEKRNQDIAGGRLPGEIGEPTTRTIGRWQKAEEIKNLRLEIDKNNNDLSLANRRVRLGDIAQVIDGTQEQRLFVTLNGKSAVKVSLQKQPDANTITTINRVKRRLQELRETGTIDPSIKLVTTLDESIVISQSIKNVTNAGIWGTGLAAIAVLLFLGSWRQTLIIVLSIPLAILTGIIGMKLFALSLNIFSLGGLALGVGIVVDNSIVMLENISAKLVNKDMAEQSRVKIAEIGAQEVESALIAATTTNLVSVLPFLMIGGFFSLLFRELILTITLAVAASLLVALTVVPMLASRLLSVKKVNITENSGFLGWFRTSFALINARYSRLLSKILPYRLLIIAASIAILGAGSWWMSQYLPQEILPAINTGQARLFLRFPTGTNLEDNLKVTQAVEKIINSSPDTQYSFITSGGFLFGNTTIENLRFSSGNITLKPGVAIDEYIEKLNRQFINLNLVDIRLRLFPARVRGLILNNSPLGNADIDVILQGENGELLQQTGKNLVKLLDEEAKLTRFRPDSEEKEREIRILPDWQKVAEFSLNTEKIGENVQAALRGSVPTQLQRGERLVDVRVQLEQAARNNINQLAQLPILIDNNHSIRLKDIAEITEGLAPREIQRINQREIYPIIGNLVGKPLEDSEIQIKPKFSDAAAEVARILQQLDLPTGVSLLPSYAARSQQELEKSLKTLGLLAIFLVFVVMAVQYNSLIDPLVIILTVPLALAGGIFGLYITQTAIGATVLMGAILLVGIVVNNAIVMVELANQLQKQANIKRHIAIIQAASSRLRPIAMTTVTTVLGMLPLTLGGGQGSEFLQPLGIVVFYGLASATLLTLFVIPCFYLLIHEFWQ